MDSRLMRLVLLVATITLLKGVTGLNIDSLTPTIVNSGLPNGEGIGFGFTLTQHEFTSGQKTVLVSAPKADGEYEREGSVYSCPFVNGGACQFQSVFQSKQNVREDDPFVAQPSTLNISYVDQLMGYSLRSSSNHVVACAPLYLHRPTIISVFGVDYLRGDPNGRCIILDRDLNMTTPLQLFSEDVDSLRVAGVDTGTVLQDGNEKLLFGSVLSGDRSIPTGQVFLTSLRSDLIGTDEISSSGGSSSFLPLTGYHVDTGYFTTADTTGTKQIVTSAPRGETHFGKIEILTIGVTLVTSYEIIGKEADGYFGYDFAVLTFDPEGVGLDGLVVGCPLCNRERGRIYIYTHTGNVASPFTETTIDSPSTTRGRFGLAVENIGDIDLDGIDDVAVSAPYEGNGVVYVYRGSPSGLVANDPQTIPAEPGTSVFGYAISGGVDIDDNGYPDITISDLSGNHVTSYRTSPLVNVTFDLENRKEVLDILGDSDRVCQLSENVKLQCFNVTPCFQFNSRNGDVTRFALTYSVVVDSTKLRASLYQVDEESQEVSILENTFTDTVTITGAGEENRVCVRPLVFALSADFTDTSPLPVQLSIDDVPSPLALDSSDASDELGGALHPIIQRYTRGDEQVPLSLEYEIGFNVECSGGQSSECEPEYQLDIEEDFMSSDNTLVLASANEFGYRVNVTNVAVDDGLNPSLIVQLPQGVLFSRSVSFSSSAVTECNSRAINDDLSSFSTAVECTLRNPTLAGKTLQLELFFLLNVTAISLEKSSLNIMFSVVDGASRNVSATASKTVMLEALGDYGITSVVSEERYQAFRGTVYRNATTIPLNETGPLISLRVNVRNIREATNGTVFPQTTLLVHLPVEVLFAEEMGRPLLVPTGVVVASGNVNCSHYEAVPQGLSIIQEPAGFIPPWTGPRPNVDPRCAEGGRRPYKCGVILCTIFNLGPSPDPPTQLTIFARLFSPSVMTPGNLTVYSQLLNETELPKRGEDSIIESTVSFSVSPAVTETLRECVQYWVVVVSVVIGILVLVVIISILACCGLFRRWYKDKKSEAANGTNGVEHTDSELFQRRTIPPIPGITQSGRGQPELTSYEATGDGLDEAEEKDKEAEEEAEFERERMAGGAEPAGDVETDDFVFDPSKGVDDDFEGEETEL